MPTLWAAVGILGAALPMLRRPAWSAPTRTIHLAMGGVAVSMAVPGAPWWLLISGPVLLAGAAGRLFRTAHGSPECVPCLLDAVAMSLLVLITVFIGMNSIPMSDHGASSFSLLGVQVGVGWVIAAYWSRTRPSRMAVPAAPGLSIRLIGAPAAVALAGSVLMAGSMSAMMVG